MKKALIYVFFSLVLILSYFGVSKYDKTLADDPTLPYSSSISYESKIISMNKYDLIYKNSEESWRFAGYQDDGTIAIVHSTTSEGDAYFVSYKINEAITLPNSTLHFLVKNADKNKETLTLEYLNSK